MSHPTHRQIKSKKNECQGENFNFLAKNAIARQIKRSETAKKIASALFGRQITLKNEEIWDDLTGLPIVDDGECWCTIGPGGELEQRGPNDAIRYAYLIQKSAEPSNNAVGLLQATDDSTFFGGMSLWKSSLRLDPSWAETMRRRSRKEAKSRCRAVMAGLPKKERKAMDRGYNHRLGWKMLTLTMPHSDIDSISQIKLLNCAFRKFTKREEWKLVYAGIKGIENKLTASGPHVHAHFLILSRYLDRTTWRRVWGECLDQAASEIELVLDYGSDNHGGDGMPFVDIRDIKRRKVNGVFIESKQSFEDALDEISKYITKPDDYIAEDARGRTINPEVLVDLCRVRRWPRMFELLGSARRPPKPRQRARLDTSCISAGETLRSLNAAHQAELLLHREERILGVHRALFGEDSNIPDATVRVIEEKRSEKSPTWRELMAYTDLGEWISILKERIERGISFRLRWLKSNMSTLYLVDLTGALRANQAHVWPTCD